MTRAKDELYLTYPLLLTDYNRQTVLQKPSRFITECPGGSLRDMESRRRDPGV